MESLTVKLPADMVAQLETLATGEDVSVGQIVRTAVDRDLRRRDAARTPTRVEERMLAPIRVRVTEDFVAACDWRDLKNRLIDKGYVLRESGGGLALHDAISGRFLCRTSEIGFGYPTLLRQYSGPFPGHSHTWLLDQIREVPVYVKN